MSGFPPKKGRTPEIYCYDCTTPQPGDSLKDFVSPKEDGDSPKDGDAQKGDDSQKGGDSFAESPACPAGGNEEAGEMLLALHLLFHPGCNCSNHGDGGGDDLEDGKQRWLAGEVPSVQEDSTVSQATTPRGKNLNLFAALLHLIADVLRGILILVLACLIQANKIQDGVRADAYCAIVVAGLVGAGSVVLFVRAGAVLARLVTFIRKRISYTVAQQSLDGQP
jgi:Co/Zn/Cd efflux system component